MGFHLLVGSVAKEPPGWVATARGVLAEDDTNPVADPTDLLVQVLGPQGSTGKEPDQEGNDADRFRSEDAHQQDHRVAKGQNAVDRDENEVEDAGAAIRRGEELRDAVKRRAGQIAREQGDYLASEREHHRRNGHNETEEDGEGVAF
mmetsp:Transcript_9781/g.23898  ORF Transcript_9781/g.23898 Transcript_9781/m.23898 type:complete len:147 (+) Transcript_9781:2002-2442(+)